MSVEREVDAWGFGGYRDPCHLRPLVTHGLGDAEWRVDTASPPGPESSTFPIEVMEHECASGQPATGRIADPIGDRVLLDGGPWPPEQRWPVP